MSIVGSIKKFITTAGTVETKRADETKPQKPEPKSKPQPTQDEIKQHPEARKK